MRVVHLHTYPEPKQPRKQTYQEQVQEMAMALKAKWEARDMDAAIKKHGITDIRIIHRLKNSIDR